MCVVVFGDVIVFGGVIVKLISSQHLARRRAEMFDHQAEKCKWGCNFVVAPHPHSKQTHTKPPSLPSYQLNK